MGINNRQRRKAFQPVDIPSFYDGLGDSQISKAVEYPNIEASLFCVGEEFDIALTTLMTHRCKTGHIVF